MGNNASAPQGQASNATQAPHKYFDDQFDDEQVLYLFRKHPIVMRKGLIIASLGLLAGPLITMGLTFARPLNPPTMTFFFLSLLGSFVLSMLLFLPSWIAWHFSVYIITDQRLIQIKQKGLFKRSVVDMGLRQIQMVNYEINGFNETVLGYGTIMMQTLVGDLIIHEVHHPDKTAKKIQLILRDQGVNATSYEVPAEELRDELYEAED